jgi:hypothetical protein
MSDVLTPQKEASWQIMDRATTQRKLLLAAGYVPIPINGKAPIIPEWQKQQPTAGDVDKWPQLYPCAFNTGILTRATPTVESCLASIPRLAAITPGISGSPAR